MVNVQCDSFFRRIQGGLNQVSPGCFFFKDNLTVTRAQGKGLYGMESHPNMNTIKTVCSTSPNSSTQAHFWRSINASVFLITTW